MNFLYVAGQTADNDLSRYESYFDKMRVCTIGDGVLLYDEYHSCHSFYEDDEYVAYVLGYVRKYDLDRNNRKSHIRAYLNEVFEDKWPLNDSFTGSFSIFSIHKKTHKIVIANDLIGINPLFYCFSTLPIVSSNIILMGLATRAENDEVGIIQQQNDPRAICYGSRTILKDVKRLLPSQLLCYHSDGSTRSLFDTYVNTLSCGHSVKEQAELIYATMAKEYEVAVSGEKTVNIAISGGMDSRMSLLFLPNDVNIVGHTYGSIDCDESLIAKKCIDVRKGRWYNYPVDKSIFCNKETLSKYVRLTGPVRNSSWVAIHEQSKKTEEFFFVGDTIGLFNGISNPIYRENRLRRTYLFAVNYFTNGKSILKKVKNKDQDCKEFYERTLLTIENYFQKVSFPSASKRIAFFEALRSDVDELLSVILRFDFDYVEQYMELLLLLTKGRLYHSRQAVINKMHYFPITPEFSLGVFRKTLMVSPYYKFNYKLMRQIFIHHGDKLGQIPTAQSAIVPFTAPSLLYFVSCGIRSTLDQIFIKRMLNARNPNKRYRLRNTSINWPQVYQDCNIAVVSSWFDPDMLQCKEKMIDTIKKRKNCEKWPLVPYDVVEKASLNIILDLLNRT